VTLPRTHVADVGSHSVAREHRPNRRSIFEQHSARYADGHSQPQATASVRRWRPARSRLAASKVLVSCGAGLGGSSPLTASISASPTGCRNRPRPAASSKCVAHHHDWPGLNTHCIDRGRGPRRPTPVEVSGLLVWASPRRGLRRADLPPAPSQPMLEWDIRSPRLDREGEDKETMAPKLAGIFV
jgi:hypothetical protein